MQASEIVQLPNASQIQEEPKNCLLETSRCAVRTRIGEKFKLSVGESVVHLDQQTAVVRLSAESVRLISGAIWVQAKSPFTVQTEFGEMKTEPGEMWVHRTSEYVYANASVNRVLIFARGAKSELWVEPGWENWIGRVGRNGVAETGVPKPIHFETYIERWARLHVGSKTSFEKAVKDFHRTWSVAVKEAAEVHQALYERKMASLEAAEQREKERRERIEAENRALREMFRRRLFEE